LHNQIESPLLRLPAELRNRIYEYVFRVDCINFFRMETWDYNSSKDSRPDYNPNPVRGTKPASQSLSSLLKSLLVCRQYYAETRLLVFKLSPLCGRPRDLLDAVEKMPRDVRDAIPVLRIYENSNWTRYYRQFYLPTDLPNLRKAEVHSWAPKVVGDPLLFAHEWNRRHVPEDNEVLRLRVEKFFRDLDSKETEDALIEVLKWVPGWVEKRLEITSIDAPTPWYKHVMGDRWEVM